MPKTLVDVTLECSRSIPVQRGTYKVFTKLCEELGEIAEEILVVNNDTYKTGGPDGLVGECIDAIACLIDLIYVANPSITEERMIEIMQTKLDKWRSKIETSQESGTAYVPSAFQKMAMQVLETRSSIPNTNEEKLAIMLNRLEKLTND